MSELQINWAAKVAEDDRGIGGGNQQARWAGDDKLWIQFHYLPMVDNEKSNKEKRPIYKDIEHIKIVQPGNRSSVINRPVEELDKVRFKKQYEAWKEGIDLPREGTPLTEWPVLTQSQVEEFKFFNARTVEDIANMSDTTAQQFPGIQSIRKQAQIFVEATKKGATTYELSKALKQRDNEIEALKQAVEEQAVMIQALNAKASIQPVPEVPEMPQVPKRGPGRPRKEG